MTIEFSMRSSSNEVSIHVYIGNASRTPSPLFGVVEALLTIFAILGYLGFFTVMKFRRVKVEKLEFAKIKKGVIGVPNQEARRLLVEQNLEKDFINGKVEGKPLKTLVEMQQL